MHGVVDSAFTSKDVEHFIRSAQTSPTTRVAEDILIYSEATSIKQLSEWGMHSLQGDITILKDRFYYGERVKRGVILKMIIRLFNICSRLVGIIQIKSTFMHNLERSASAQLIM